jgi:mycofactocin system transcriptional regulator
VSSAHSAVGQPRVGRPPVTSREAIELVAMELFSTVGFDATTVDDIAAAAGIGRRTFFRYFGSKNDVVWGRFAEGLVDLAATLAAMPADRSVAAGLREAIVAFNALPPEQVPVHRLRMSLIFSAESLQAHSTLMYAQWRRVIADFVATRTGLDADALLPRLVGHVMLGAAVSAYEQWLVQPGADLPRILGEAVDLTVAGLGDL